MIDSLILKEFQKHKLLRIDLDRHVTAVVGRTGAGKSCVVRALRFALLNRGPSQPGRRVKGGSRTATVSVGVGGNHLSRRKGDKVNTYSVRRKEGRQKYKAFGLGKVPEEVGKLTKVQEINFQGQHDPAFWFTLTPGQVSKQLNRIVNLEVIDNVLGRAASEVRKANARLDVSKERLTQAKQEVKSLIWADDLAADLAELQAKHSDLATIVIKRSVLRGLYSDGLDAYSTTDLASKAILCARRAVVAGEQWAKVKARQGELSALVKTIRRYQAISKVAVPEIETLRNIRAEADKAAEDRRALEYIVTEALEARNNLCQVQEQLDKKEKRLTKIKVCPTCGRKMSSQSSAATSTCKKGHR